MKHFKKMMALIIALVMVAGTLSLSSAFAATTSRDPKIEITGLEDVKSVDFYQILEWKGAQGAYAGWSLKAPFTAFANGYADEKTAIKELVGDPGGNPAVEMKLSADIAGKLAKMATASAKIAPTTLTDDTATLTLSNTDSSLGLYMALITPKDQDYVYNPVFVSADFNTSNPSASWEVTKDSTYYGQGAAKKSKVDIDKQAEVSQGTTYDSTWLSTRIGETVEYSVKTTIPGYGPVFENPHFVVKDKLTGLKLTGAPTVVKPADAVYTITAGGTADADNYEITFDKAYLKTVNAPTEVVITYEAKVTEEADTHINAEKNEVWVEFNHDTTDESHFNYHKDDTNHYTFDIDANVGEQGGGLIGESGSEIVKIGVDAAGNPITSEKTWSKISPGAYQEGPLPGAKFKLYTKATCTAADEYKTVDGKTLDLESKEDGRITIEGLDAGTYWLKETDAPNGYIADQRAIEIRIEPEYEEVDVTQYTNGTDWQKTETPEYSHAVTYKVQVLKKVTIYVNGVAGATHTFEHDGGNNISWIKHSAVEIPSSIVNTKGVELPSTGGIGTTVFYVIGAVLVVGAGILLVTRRRMDVE